MPETRQHRGPHPNDARLFHSSTHGKLRKAVGDLSWLLSRGYAQPSSLKLVGDRYALTRRQRDAVRRCACADAALARRLSHECKEKDVAGRTLLIDGFNVITTIEAALAGGVLVHARDGCVRDLASMHGSYRKVHETIPAVRRIGSVLASLQVDGAHWLLDAPVSNSGRLKTILQSIADENNWQWTVEVVPDPDRVLIGSTSIVATSDSAVLDRCTRWFALTREIVERQELGESMIELSGE